MWCLLVAFLQSCRLCFRIPQFNEASFFGNQLISQRGIVIKPTVNQLKGARQGSGRVWQGSAGLGRSHLNVGRMKLQLRWTRQIRMQRALNRQTHQLRCLKMWWFRQIRMQRALNRQTHHQQLGTKLDSALPSPAGAQNGPAEPCLALPDPQRRPARLPCTLDSWRVDIDTPNESEWVKDVSLWGSTTASSSLPSQQVP